MKHLRLAILLTLLLSALTFSTTAAQSGTPVVRAVMFWMDGCQHCEQVIQQTLPPIQQKYGEQFQLTMIEVVTIQDIENLYRVAASYNISKKETGVPFLIVGDHVLIGEQQIPDELPGLIEQYLDQGGVDLPINPILASVLNPDPSAASELPLPEDSAPVSARSNGFTLAVVVMVGMVLALLYSVISFILGRTFSLHAWADWLIPALIVVGVGVAAYLSYVEMRSVKAICGPVGDCNAVQQSRYAKLFGILPVGVLGLGGYLAMLSAWLVRKYRPQFTKPAAIAFFGMAFFAVTYSVYLTYLELFVIQAVCIWCITSAVIVTLLLLLALPSAIAQFAIAEGDDPDDKEG